MNREAWLNAIAARMAPLFAELGYPLPDFRVSIGFTSGGMRSNANAEVWSNKASADGKFEILIRIDQDDSTMAAALLAHELCHTAVGLQHGHKGPFVTLMKAIGLTKPFTSTVPTEAFKDWVKPFIDELGEIPHGALNYLPATIVGRRTPGRTKVGLAIRDGLDGEAIEEIITSAKKKQTTRMKKAECGLCGYTVRATQKWLDIGPPLCPTHKSPMEIHEGTDASHDE